MVRPQLTIGNLFLIISLLALLLAAFQSRVGGVRQARIASFGISPDGKQVAIAACEWLGQPNDIPKYVDRTISLIDWSSGRPLQVLPRDRMYPDSERPISEFWNQQLRVKLIDNRLAFLSDDASSLQVKQIGARESEFVLTAPTGQIYGFDISDNGRVLLAYGVEQKTREHYLDEPEAYIWSHLAFDFDTGPSSLEVQPNSVTPFPDQSEFQPGDEWARCSPSGLKIGVSQPEFAVLLHHEMDPKFIRSSWWQSGRINVRHTMIDADAGDGFCFLASVYHTNRVVLHLATPEWNSDSKRPTREQYISTGAYIVCPTNEESRLKLCPKQPMLAVSTDNEAQLLDFSDYEISYTDDGDWEANVVPKWFGGYYEFSQVRKQVLTAELPITALEFTPDGKHLMLGHNSDLVTIWELASGKQIGSIRAPLKPSGLRWQVIAVLFLCWLVVAFAVRRSRVSRPSYETDDSDAEDSDR